MSKKAKTGSLLKKFDYERELWAKGIELIAGVDEVGRGPLAGPVVAASVIFPEGMPVEIPVKIDDSKKLTEKQRHEAYSWIIEHASCWGVGIVSVETIDKYNIRRAAIIAMKRAIENMPVQPEHLLIDGLPIEHPPYPQTAIIKGDQLSISIAAASIIAKTVRDELMIHYYDPKYPDYQFARHKGYGTQIHTKAIQKFGYSPIHRRSFHLKNSSQEDLFKE